MLSMTWLACIAPLLLIADVLMSSTQANNVAAGMLYLHTRSPPLIHRDLKSPNLLVSLGVTKPCWALPAKRMCGIQ
jgi:hypothetical protein